MHSEEEISNKISNEEKPILSDIELHVQANQYISEFNQLVFQNLPSVMSQIIEREVWKKEIILIKTLGNMPLINHQTAWVLLTMKCCGYCGLLWM